MKKLLICALAFAGLQFNANAQSYDGEGDSKIFLGYANVGGKSGVQVQFDYGLSDLVSYGMDVTILIKPDDRESTDSFDDSFKAFDSFDLGGFLRFHFSEPLNLSEKIDPYLGLDVSLRSIGGHAGIKYNFSEIIGVYVMYKHSFSSSITGDHKIVAETYDAFDDNVNFFGKVGTISGGVTINIF